MEQHLLLFYVSLLVGAIIFHKRKNFKIYYSIYTILGFLIFSFYVAKEIKAYDAEMANLKHVEERILE
jgi:hypothetical protein